MGETVGNAEKSAKNKVDQSERNSRAALKRGAQRSAKLKTSIEKAIQTIQQEISENDGIYPKNGGNVTILEVVNRAGIHEGTVYKKHNDDLKTLIDNWLLSLKKVETVGRARVRRSLKKRDEDWRQKYLDLEASHIATSLQLQQEQAESLRVKAENEALRGELARQAAAKVVPLKPKETP